MNRDTYIIQVEIDHDLKEKLDKVCARGSRSRVIRALLQRFLADVEKNEHLKGGEKWEQ